MPNLKAIFNFRIEWQKEFNIPKGFILLRYKPIYRKNLGKLLQKLNEWQNNKEKQLIESGEQYTEDDFLRDLECDLSVFYRKATLDQKRLSWSLYEIEANEQNAGMKGHKDQMVTATELYEADLYEHGVRETIITKRCLLGRYLEDYRIIEGIVHKGNPYELHEFTKKQVSDTDQIEIHVIRGQSKFNTMEMSQWIEMQFNRLAYMGVNVTEPGEIKKYWHDFKQYLNDNQIEFTDIIMTKEQYKYKNPSCEGCGDPIIGTGHLAHIKAVGMGQDRTKEPTRNYSSNWLHLCTDCHIGTQHQKGWTHFLELNKHLTHKVNKALKRDYNEIPQRYEPEGGEVEKVHTESSEPPPQDQDARTEPEKKAAADRELQETVKKIVASYNAGLIDKDDACKTLDEIGSDGCIIDKSWLGIF
jgi:hypothetical protein